MNVLIDTSVWVDHFRNRNNTLISLIQADLALTHPMVVGEIACGTPPAPRSRTLNDIELLRPANHASLKEVMDFIEREKLYGQGCGLVDITLLASTLITPDTTLWTLDRRLSGLAERFQVDYQLAQWN
ncbi:type II toxin-antitoxin system VapC family toxin [Zooshikella harenae]|uniref:VapC toxin family PIN domain ribonuclease n=1 Tax=Zooshikella harenae TaxID=2827238 RepID=A0ABS5ZJQ9_9GAMM|nr:VapC toxin family PIN domain ribonuclease [Zooshikella harenae]MBU2714175.1 VapC toxin family PIN domain ribonuclease [Zooshikella harenae]